MLGLGDVLAQQQLLVQLLAVAQADVLDGDIAVGMLGIAHLQAHQPDHGPGEVVDLHRLAHVEDEHVAAGGHGAGLDHERRSLRDRHEVADRRRGA